MITKIETTQAMDTMGDCTESDLASWCNHLDNALNSQYPGAEITVKANARQSSTTLHVETSDDQNSTPHSSDPEGDVREFINYVWSKWA